MTVGINPSCFLHIDLSAIAAQVDMDAPIAIPHASLANLLDASFGWGLSGAAEFVVVGRCIEPQDLAGPSD